MSELASTYYYSSYPIAHFFHEVMPVEWGRPSELIGGTSYTLTFPDRRLLAAADSAWDGECDEL